MYLVRYFMRFGGWLREVCGLRVNKAEFQWGLNSKTSQNENKILAEVVERQLWVCPSDLACETDVHVGKLFALVAGLLMLAVAQVVVLVAVLVLLVLVEMEAMQVLLVLVVVLLMVAESVLP